MGFLAGWGRGGMEEGGLGKAALLKTGALSLISRTHGNLASVGSMLELRNNCPFSFPVGSVKLGTCVC